MQGFVVCRSAEEAKAATPDQIWFGTVYRLGFRLRVGAFLGLATEKDSESVFISNKPAVAWGDPKYKEACHTLVLISTKVNHVDQGILARIRSLTLDGPVTDWGQELEHRRILRRLIVGYHAVVKTFVSGGRIRVPNDDSLLNPYLRVAFVVPTMLLPSDEFAKEAFSVDPGMFVMDPFKGPASGDISDLPQGTTEALAARFKDSSFAVADELRLKAITAKVDGDDQVALVLACAAMEGSHGALLRAALLPRLETDSSPEELLNNLLREQGIHTLFRISMVLYVPQELRVDASTLDRCKRALEMRNDIVHVKFSKGKFKLSSHSQAELEEAYGAALKVGEVFQISLERLIRPGVSG